MNERIRELAKQADPENWHSRWYSGISPRVMDPEIKKFVESIVRECANAIQAERDAGFYNAQQMAGMTVSETVIKDHFGIKE